MGEFIDKNRRLLKFCCGAVQTIGWALIFMGVIWFVLFMSGSSAASAKRTGSIESIVYAVSWFLFGFMVPGLAAVGIAQLARYLFENKYQPGWILRHGELFIYLLAVIEVAWAVFRYFYFVGIMQEPASRLLYAQPLILPTIVKVLILVGLGQILRRIMPVIEESKTLV